MTILVVMGVAGSGKTTVAEGLAEALDWPFRDADSFHPATNVAKMASGIPLADEDRWPWLDAIVTWMNAQHEADKNGVVTCSALKRSYRDRLRTTMASIKLVHLHGSRELLSARITARKAHFMPASLLDSQLATLEMPDNDECAITIIVDKEPAQIIADIQTFQRAS